jgi:UDP-GlcNAc:undecaprenyl-phosphate GlcNAc-1-phosphate transferase
MRVIPTFGEVLPLLIVTFVVAMLLAVGLTPLVRRLMLRLDAIDTPDQRRVNKSPLPRGGGIAVAFAFLVVAVGVLVVNDRLDMVDVPFTISTPELSALLAGGALATVIGFLDDYFQLRARWQLLGQLAVALLAVAAGITVTYLNNPFGAGTIPLEGAFATGFTILWIVGMINSINFIDGLDGLSSGIALIAALTLGLF